jgi:hypothetical protein
MGVKSAYKLYDIESSKTYVERLYRERDLRLLIQFDWESSLWYCVSFIPNGKPNILLKMIY